MWTASNAAKVRALTEDPRVALTIDTDAPPEAEFTKWEAGVTRFTLNPSLASYVRNKLADLG